MGGVGRLGYQLFQYAAVVGAAKRNGRITLVTRPLKYAVEKYFDIGVSVHVAGATVRDENLFRNSSTRIREKYLRTYLKLTENLPVDRNGTIDQFFQSRLYFAYAE